MKVHLEKEISHRTACGLWIPSMDLVERHISVDKVTCDLCLKAERVKKEHKDKRNGKK